MIPENAREAGLPKKCHKYELLEIYFLVLKTRFPSQSIWRLCRHEILNICENSENEA